MGMMNPFLLILAIKLWKFNGEDSTKMDIGLWKSIF